jgi:predicted DNA-binding transcriptional regulator YafY
MKASVHLFALDSRIRAKEYPSASSLSLELGISERAVFRDRKKLIEWGANIGWDKERGGWFYRDQSFVLPTILLGENELLAFFLSVEIARSSGNAGFEAALQSAVAKIRFSVGEIVSVDLNTLRDSTSYALSHSAPINAGFHAELAKAGAHRQKVRMRYFTASRGETNWRVVHPYNLRFIRGEWLLIALDEGKNAIRCFNIHRISEMETLADRFVQQSEFDINDFVRAMFVAEVGDQTFDIVIQFDGYQARYIRERPWHPEQKLTNEPEDGGAILTFPASGLQEIARWVLGFGRHARVLEPPQLVELVQAHVAEMAAMYNK